MKWFPWLHKEDTPPVTLESFKQSPGKVVMDENGYAGLSPDAADQIERLRQSKGWGFHNHSPPDMTDEAVLDFMMKEAFKSARKMGIEPKPAILRKGVQTEMACQKQHGVVLSAAQGLHQRHREELKQSFWTGVAVGAPVGVISWVLGLAFA